MVAPADLIPEGELSDGYRISGRVVGDDSGHAGVAVEITSADTFGTGRNLALRAGQTRLFRNCGNSSYSRNGYMVATLGSYEAGDHITLYGAWDVYAANNFGGKTLDYCAYNAEGYGPGPAAPGRGPAYRTAART